MNYFQEMEEFTFNIYRSIYLEIHQFASNYNGISKSYILSFTYNGTKAAQILDIITISPPTKILKEDKLA